MKKLFAVILCAVTVSFLSAGGFAKETKEELKGEELFKKHCAVCHPAGRNIVNPQKPLSKKEREASKVATVEDIVKLMRNPGPGMVKFGDKTISEEDAKAIAEYILKTFK